MKEWPFSQANKFCLPTSTSMIKVIMVLMAILWTFEPIKITEIKPMNQSKFMKANATHITNIHHHKTHSIIRWCAHCHLLWSSHVYDHFILNQSNQNHSNDNFNKRQHGYNLVMWLLKCGISESFRLNLVTKITHNFHSTIDCSLTLWRLEYVFLTEKVLKPSCFLCGNRVSLGLIAKHANVTIVHLRSGHKTDPIMDPNNPAQGVPADPNAPAQGAQVIDMQVVLQQMQQQAADIAVLQAQLVVVQALGNLVAAQIPVFTLTPALAQTGIINFTSASGIKLWKTITMPLMTLYNGSVGNLALFLDEVQHCTNDSGWNQDLLTISD